MKISSVLIDFHDQFTECETILHEMDQKEYDRADMLWNIVTSIRHAGNYPHTLTTPMISEKDNSELSPRDIEIFNRGVEKLYHSTFYTLRSHDCYDKNGTLRHPYFIIRNNDVLFSNCPVEEPPLE